MDALLDFSNKSVLITGAASGFGRMLAIGLASRGAGLVLADFNAAGLAETVETVKGLGVHLVQGYALARPAFPPPPIHWPWI